MYDDNSLITFGKYKFTRLCRVPASYLLNMYFNKSCPDYQLKEYIEQNIEAIIQRQQDVISAQEFKIICKKKTYISEKDAKLVLKLLKTIKQEHKKPVRAYKCDICELWHLTSIPLEEWKRLADKK